MTFFPLMLDLRGRPVLLVGGGPETARRAQALLAAGARLTVLCPQPLSGLEELAAAGRVRWLRRAYREGDLAESAREEPGGGFWLVVSCAADKSLNAALAREAEALRVFLVAADDPAHASAIFPAVHRQGDFVITVSTGGKAPALAVRVRDRLRQEYGPPYGEFTDLLGALREEVARRVRDPEVRRALWYRLVDSPALGLVAAGDPGGARRLLERLIETAPAGPVRPPARCEPYLPARPTPHPLARPEGCPPEQPDPAFEASAEAR